MNIGIQTWGSEGDVRPFIALANGLVKAGNSVTLVISTDKPRNFKELANKYGFDVKLLIPSDGNDQIESEVWHKIIWANNPVKQAEMILKYGFDPVVDDMYTASKELCRNNDLVIGHFFVYPLQIAAELAGIPMVTLNIVYNCQPSKYICPPGFPDLGKWSYKIGWSLVAYMLNKIFLPRINSLRAKEGLNLHKNVMLQTWASDRLNLIAVSSNICQLPSDWPSNNYVCGFLNTPTDSAIEEIPESLNEFIERGSAPIYATFGSMMTPFSNKHITDTLTIWMSAIKKLNCRGILQVPTSDFNNFTNDPDFIIITRSPYLSVFPKCKAVIHHGGAGTTQSALMSGIPSIIVAHMVDQYFWGSELERLGVAAKTIKRASLTKDNLADSISMLLTSDKYKKNAEELGQKLKTENGVENAVNKIKEIFNSVL